LLFHTANSPDVEPQKTKLSKFIIGNILETYYTEYGIKNADLIVAQAEYQDELLQKHYGKKCNLIMPNISPDVYMRRPKSVSNKKRFSGLLISKSRKGRTYS
jgi:hypothetical protein